MNIRSKDGQSDAGFIIICTISALILIGACFGTVAGCQSYQRGQKVKNANNNVHIAQIKAHNSVILTDIAVQRQEQEARRIAARDGIVRAQATQRVIQARGIAEAQRLIAKTLTPLYVQFEAIQNQASGKNERIYIPVGPQGVPLVANVNGSSVGPEAP